MKILRSLSAILLCVAFAGCAATQIALEKKDLKVETQMSDTIFLDVEAQVERTIFVDIKNTSDKNIDIVNPVINNLTARGYRVTFNPKEAFYILQGNILYVGKADPSALRQSLYAGYGGALAGSMLGAVVGGATHGSTGALVGAGAGALVGGAAELVAGSLVKDVTYTVVTDLMISEKSAEKVDQRVHSNLKQGRSSTIQQSSQSVTERKKYQTRIVSSANQVNLTFEEALPPLVDGLARSIAGIF